MTPYPSLPEETPQDGAVWKQGAAAIEESGRPLEDKVASTEQLFSQCFHVKDMAVAAVQKPQQRSPEVGVLPTFPLFSYLNNVE